MEGWEHLIFPFLWVLLRTLGTFVSAPVLGTRFVPWIVRMTIALALSCLTVQTVPVAEVPADAGSLALAALGEIAFGLALGFIATIPMAAVEMAGQIADLEVGFGMSNVIDPQYGEASPLLATLKYLVIMMVFLTLDGHHVLLRALKLSFDIVPAGSASVPAIWGDIGLKAVYGMFWAGLLLASPIWVSMLVVDVAIGLVSYSVPQMNVLVMGMPIKVLAGLAVLAASVGLYGHFASRLIREMTTLIESLLGVFVR